MAALANTKIGSFNEKHRDLVDNVKRSMLHYVKAINTASGHQDNDADDVDIEPAGQIKLTVDQFPILPEPALWIRARKLELEKILRAYMGYHYSKSGRSTLSTSA